MDYTIKLIQFQPLDHNRLCARYACEKRHSEENEICQKTLEILKAVQEHVEKASDLGVRRPVKGEQFAEKVIEHLKAKNCPAEIELIAGELHISVAPFWVRGDAA